MAGGGADGQLSGAGAGQVSPRIWRGAGGCSRCPGLPELRAALDGSGIEARGGAEALVEAAAQPADLTLAAIVGCVGLAPTMAAIEQGNSVALANKEALVSAGGVMTAAVAKHGATLLPVDSEHNARSFSASQATATITSARSRSPPAADRYDWSAEQPRLPPRRRRSSIPTGIWAPRSASIARRCSTRAWS